MNFLDETCWADPLSRGERAYLAKKFARASNRFYATAFIAGRMSQPDLARQKVALSVDCIELHLDVTERAA